MLVLVLQCICQHYESCQYYNRCSIVQRAERTLQRDLRGRLGAKPKRKREEEKQAPLTARSDRIVGELVSSLQISRAEDQQRVIVPEQHGVAAVFDRRSRPRA